MAKILVMDDSASMLGIVEEMLRSAGHEVVTADSGRKGVSILTSQPLDLAITDIFMPDMDGLEVIRTARRLRPGLPVLAMSVAAGKRGLLDAARALGAAETLLKPFSTEELLGAVNACLPGADPADGGRTGV